MVDISSYAPSLSAVGAARASTTQATNVATSYGERPTYRDDAVAAGTAIQAMSSKISRLNDVRSLERIDGLLDVTLATTDAIVDTLTEMKTLAARLQDQSLSDDMRATLTNEYNALLPRINELSEMASFGGRNILNPDAAQISGDLELPDGQVIEARDLRNGQGQILALSGGGQGGSGGGGSSAQAPFIGDLSGAFAFEGDLDQVGIGKDTLSPLTVGPYSFSNGGLETAGGVFIASPAYAAHSTFLNINALSGGDLAEFTFGSDTINISVGAGGLNVDVELAGEIFSSGLGNLTGSSSGVLGITYQSAPGETAVNIYVGPNSGVQFRGPGQLPQGHSSNGLTLQSAARFNDVAIYEGNMSQLEVAAVMASMASGVENWVSGSGGGSGGGGFEWDAVHAALDVSLSNALAAQANYGGAARSAELKSQIQQRMVDAIDSATARLVNKDIDRLGALRAAGEVREQLALAMMQTQTNTLLAQTSLFSNALGMFDAINLGGFKPQGLSFD